MEQTTYILSDGTKPIGWQLPLNGVLIQKVENGKKLGLKKIKYVSGTSSYYAEDIAGDLKAESIWFNNGRIIVPNVDTLKNALLQAHPWFNKKYEVFDKDLIAKKELDTLRVKGNARKLIEESDTEKIRAIALALFGQLAFTWSEATCELELLKYADTKPQELQKELQSKDYESKYLSALAFSKGIVKTNNVKSSVQWNDTTDGVILRLAKGENGINKLGELLSNRTDESELILQEIGVRLKKLETNVPNDKSKDDEIAQLKKKLKGLEAKGNNQTFSTNGKAKTETPLETVQKKYVEKFNKQLPARYKNDIEWLTKKIEESK
jgi:hypothetical protein